MKKQIFTTISLVLVMLADAQTTLTFQPNGSCGKDAFISDYRDYVNRNFGCHDDFLITAWTAGGSQVIGRSLIEFDLSDIPSNATVSSAKLYFYAHNSLSGNPQSTGYGNVLVKKINEAWNEYTVTWNNQPTSSTILTLSAVGNGQNLTIDITSQVQYWVNNPNTNNGLLFMQENETYYRSMLFASSDDANPNVHPKLVITLASNENIQLTDCNTKPIITANGELSLCENGSVTLTSSSATGNYWSTGASTQSITVSNAGSYWVKVSNPCGQTSVSDTIIVTVGDQQNPVARCRSFSLQLNDGIGTLMASDINDGSSDNCHIASLSVYPSVFTCNDIGTNNVTLTVTDDNNNYSTCEATVTVDGYAPTCSIAVTPGNNTYTGGVATNLYLGYGPQSATITANANGGSGFAYSWSPSTNLNCTSCQSPVFTPTAEGNYTYTLTVTNSNGCSSTCEVSFCVKDIRVNGQNKVYLCHGSQTIAASVNAIAAHLANHNDDRLGKCDNTCALNKRTVESEVIFEENESLNIACSPNPFTHSFKLRHESDSEQEVQISIYGITGNLVQQAYLPVSQREAEFGEDLPAGIYTVSFVQENNCKVFKVIKID